MSKTRAIGIRALAKINLDLRVLGKRPDSYHELRTIFQTISLADYLDISFTPGRRTEIGLFDALGIPDNLARRAAVMAMDAMKATGVVDMRLRKRIPMGGGLGGGSSDAAAVLLALPALAGKTIPLTELLQIARILGSDVPFFLMGGTAAGIGRGTELFPMEDRTGKGLLVAPGLHVDTARAYRDLSPRLTSESQENKIFSFQAQVWERGAGAPPENDFETVVFEQDQHVAGIKRGLLRAGATVALMSGSGSAVYGLFPDSNRISAATQSMRGWKVFPFTLVTGKQYHAMWWRKLSPYIEPKIWPPRSRDA